MRCYFTYLDGEKYLIPGCIDVMHTDDIRDCTCPQPTTEHRFMKERFNAVLKDKNETIKILLSENKRLIKELDKKYKPGK